MDTFTGSLAIYAPVAIVVILALYVTVMMWQRVLREDHPLLLGRMLAHEGGPRLANAAAEGAELPFAIAVRRCMCCPSHRQCSEWLDSGKKTGYAEFCPNADFIQHLKR